MDAGGEKNNLETQPWHGVCLWPVVDMFIRRQYKGMKFVWGN